MKISYSTISKTGKRSNNEDAFNVIDAPEKGCWMGTTMVMASIQGGRITVAHIGDSRCYLLRSGYYEYEDITNTDKN